MNSVEHLIQNSRAWPFDEARKLNNRLGGQKPEKGYVLFETGYGPSGLPHIGTFGEVVRTTMVRSAFTALTGLKSRLFAFSDDMDGLRSIPQNIPNSVMLEKHLGKPLSSVPDPFGKFESFGYYNNARLREFLDEFGFDYEFQSATACYKDGKFDKTLLKLLNNLDEVTQVILPTLGPERRATYCPFLPICPDTGVVLQIPAIATDIDSGTITFQLDEGGKLEVPVTGGHCKLQWKADWAMRWTALAVDYEMSGKDLIDSVRLSSRICKILGGRAPEGFTYELFLDQDGEKISKSRGNGLTVEEWLRYAPQESLQLYMFNSPRKAKRLYFDVIPRHVDDYLKFLEGFHVETDDKRVENPVWHIHSGQPPSENNHITFSLLLNLVSACNTDEKAVLWGFITRYAPTANPKTAPILDSLVEYAINYYKDFVQPKKVYRRPNEQERIALGELVIQLQKLNQDASSEEIQKQVYEVGKNNGFENLRYWFKALYETLLGCEQGPRMGSFISLYGIEETVDMIERVLSNEEIS